MNTHFEIKSDKFPPVDGEEELINPDLWGQRLAEYISTHLQTNGYETEELIPEDWGWWVPIKNDEFKLWVGCGHQYGASDTFLCFIDPSKPVIHKLLKKISTTATIEKLSGTREEIFTHDPEIKEFRWLKENEI